MSKSRILVSSLLIVLLSTPAFADWNDYISDAERGEIIAGEKAKKSFTKGMTKLEKKIGKVTDILAEMSIALEVKETVEILKSLGVTPRYKYKSGPSEIGKYYSRLDRYRLDVELKPGTYISDDFLEVDDDIKVDDFFLNFSMEPGVEISFLRLFESRKKARLATPYSPARIPLNAQKAIDHLSPGDLAVFEGHMNFVLGAGDGLLFVGDILSLSGYVGATLSGKFRVFVFRGDDKKVRIRIAAVKGFEREIEIKIGADEALRGHVPGVIRKPLVRLLGLDELLKLGFGRINQDSYMADYTLNLADEDVRNAYDNLWSRGRRLKVLADIALVGGSGDKLKEKLVSNLDELNELARSDYKSKTPRVLVNFRGTNYAKGKRRELGVNLARLYVKNLETIGRDNRMAFVETLPEGDLVRHFAYPSRTTVKETSVLFSLVAKEKDERYSNVVFEVDQATGEPTFHSLGFYRNRSDNSLKPSEHQSVINALRAVLPEELYTDVANYLNDKGWLNLDGREPNVRISTRYFMLQKGLASVRGVSAQTIQDKILEIIRRADKGVKAHHRGDALVNTIGGSQNPMKVSDGMGNTCSVDVLKNFGVVSPHNNTGPAMLRYCNEITDLSRSIARILNTDYEINELMRELKRLDGNDLFNYLGPGLVLELLPQRDDLEMGYFELVINARSLEKPLIFRFGNSDDRILYEQLLDFDRFLNDEFPDLRIYGDKESKTEKIGSGSSKR